jgi:hypothetical protein
LLFLVVGCWLLCSLLIFRFVCCLCVVLLCHNTSPPRRFVTHFVLLAESVPASRLLPLNRDV